MPCSVTTRLPPRRIGEDMRNQRMASAPSRSKTSRHVRVVAQRLAHLLAVAAQHDAVADARLERRPVEQRRGQDVHRVEPAAGLADVLDDEVAREVVLEPVGVLERVVHLGERHRAGVEPARRAPPAPGASSTCPVGSSGLGRVSSSMNGRCRSVTSTPKSRSSSVERAVDVDPRVARVVGLPHRDRAAPEPVPADRPVAGVRQPLAELAVLDVLGHPGDLLVELDHPVLELGHLDEPATTPPCRSAARRQRQQCG